MSLRNDIAQAQTKALKEKEQDRLSVLRMLMAGVKNGEIEKKRELEDEEVEKIVAVQIKQQNDAIKDFSSAGRDDLVKKAEAEIEIMKEFVPEQMSDEELKSVVEGVIKETGASGAQEMGKVMGVVMKQVQGKADGNRVKEMAIQLLS